MQKMKGEENARAVENFKRLETDLHTYKTQVKNLVSENTTLKQDSSELNRLRKRQARTFIYGFVTGNASLLGFLYYFVF